MFPGRRSLYAAVAALVLARSAIFVFWPQSYFDANQAVIGLMAKHLAEGRAWPLFMYGQSYLLAVEAWLAAPLFLLFGVSVAALKLPLLIINVAVALLLLRVLDRDVGLSPASAAMASLFVVLPSPATTAQLLEASGGNVETFLWVLLLWLARARPGWCGLVLGVGVLQRPFTLYGYVSLLLHPRGATRVVQSRGAPSRRRDGLHRIGRVADCRDREACGVGAGSRHDAGGSSQAHAIGRNRAPRVLRVAHDPARIREARVAALAAPLRHQPQRLVGIWHREPCRSRDVGGRHAARRHHGYRGRRIGYVVARERRWRPELDACAYLVLAGALSASAYVIARCGVLTIYKMNYDLLSLLGAVGIAAWYLKAEPSARLRIHLADGARHMDSHSRRVTCAALD